MPLPSDRWSESLPVEFGQEAQSLWEAARLVAGEAGHDCVYPWCFFCAWLNGLPDVPTGITALGLTAAKIREVAGKSQMLHRPTEPDSLPPYGSLVESFALALIDAYRFTGRLHDVDYRWIIPNLIQPNTGVPQMIVKLTGDCRASLREVLKVLGDPYPELFGHYVFRYGPGMVTKETEPWKQISRSADEEQRIVKYVARKRHR